MKWYAKFLPYYEKPFDEAPAEVVARVRENMRRIQSDEPMVTVAAIAWNEEQRLLPCLWSLSEQQCKYPIEIICVDNNSKDRTAEVSERLGAITLREPKQGPGHARTCALNRARGKYFVNIDADTMYPPRYVETMVDALIRRNLVGVGSAWSYIPDEQHSAFGLWCYETLRDIFLRIQAIKRPQMSVRGMVFAHDTELARRVGIRTDIRRGEDGSLAHELLNYGRIGFIHRRKARAVTGYGTLSQDGSLWDSFVVRAKKGFASCTKFFRRVRPEDIRDQESNLIRPKKEQ